MIHLKHTLAITSYEGARVGTVPGANAVNVQFQCESLLNDRNVHDYSIVLNPSDPGVLNEGDFFEVSISAGYAGNSLLGGWFYADRTLVQSCALRSN